MKQGDAELVDMQAKLRNTEATFYELVASRNQQVGEYEKERVNVRAKLEAKESELEAIHGRGEGLDQEQSRGRLGQHCAGSGAHDVYVGVVVGIIDARISLFVSGKPMWAHFFINRCICSYGPI